MAKHELELTRCDRCTQPAKVDALIGDSELKFCGHHFDANKDALEAAGAVIVHLGESEEAKV